MSMQYLYYNLRRREQRSNESFDETLQRTSAKNEVDRLRKQKHYRQHIREYNAELAFATMGVEIKAPPETSCFHIHGQIYHMVSPLYSNERNKPGYGRLYIFESSAADRRMESNQACLHSVDVGDDERFIMKHKSICLINISRCIN
ncbi:hypothetical protein AVEN_251966-1 [Araneus ventricosus]|uniref:Helitron helicase-like domain-containing protein n=1 Tax=Araneus ventricosus TaxID=182803 RepID=A0A4Y2HMG1_ARAVE|nr:hypothetical protein AVEN_251966-1 [Araneus ventricosus]